MTNLTNIIYISTLLFSISIFAIILLYGFIKKAKKKAIVNIHLKKVTMIENKIRPIFKSLDSDVMPLDKDKEYISRKLSTGDKNTYYYYLNLFYALNNRKREYLLKRFIEDLNLTNPKELFIEEKEFSFELENNIKILSIYATDKELISDYFISQLTNSSKRIRTLAFFSISRMGVIEKLCSALEEIYITNKGKYYFDDKEVVMAIECFGGYKSSLHLRLEDLLITGNNERLKKVLASYFKEAE